MKTKAKLIAAGLLSLLSQHALSLDLEAERALLSEDSACYSAIDNPGSISETVCQLCLEEIQQAEDSESKEKFLNKLADTDCGSKVPYPEAYKSGWSLFFDQDLLTLDSWTDLNDDRNYTMGLGFSFSGEKYSKGYLSGLRNPIDNLFNFDEPGDTHVVENIHSFDYGVTAFTPGDLEDRDTIGGDRPYASLLYFSNAKLRAYNDDSATKSKFTVAILGLDIAKGFQRFVHNQLGLSDEDPLGWSNQISDGGEPTLLYSVDRMHLWKEKQNRGGLEWDISYSYSGNIGYYTDAAIGGDVRIGKINSPFYAHSANPLSNYNHAVCRRCKRDFYGFMSYRARLVGYNVLLQGQFRDSEHTLSGSDVENLVHEAALGVAYDYNKNWKFTYALHYKSEEFKGTEERAHWFGGLYLTRNFNDFE